MSAPDVKPGYREKTAAIFRELVGERAARVGWRVDTRDTIFAALSSAAEKIAADPEESAMFNRALPLPVKPSVLSDIAFHLIDWGEDAAFLVALQMFPERFTADEIAEGVADFLIHAPNHVAAAAVLSGWPPEDIFGVTDAPEKLDEA